MKVRASEGRSGWRTIPVGVWALGLGSMLMDTSSGMIHALLPVYLVTVLGTSALTVGLIEGVAEATTSIIKMFSGALSDRLGKRKVLAALGYGLAALSRPIFPLASSVGWLIAARFIDRFGSRPDHGRTITGSEAIARVISRSACMNRDYANPEATAIVAVTHDTRRMKRSRLGHRA